MTNIETFAMLHANHRIGEASSGADNTGKPLTTREEPRMADTISNLPDETWKPVAGFEGRYEVSDAGHVRDAATNTKLNGSFDRYAFVRLRAGSRWLKKYIHRLVAQAFCAQHSSADIHVNHLDGNKRNNSASNLEWTTQRKNNRHAYREGLIPSGENHHWARLRAEHVAEIRKLRGRVTQRVLAGRFHVSQATISAIQLNKCWATKSRCADV